MKEIEKHISTLIQSQFPSFYNEEGETFIAFVKAYYEWLEQTGNTLYHTRRLLDYNDIDQTLDQFIRYFKEQYLKNIRFTTDSNKKLFIKHALEFYKSKGSQRSVELFFRLIYGIPVQIYVPGEDIFRLSSAEYVNSQYLEITQNTDNINFVGRQITGSNSKATAFVEKLVKKKINSQIIDVLFISNRKKDFKVGEAISYSNNFTNSPRIIGSLSRFEVINGGSDFQLGEIVDIDSSTTGTQGKARVTGVENITGLVNFELQNSGWGYATNSSVLVSEKVLVVNNVIMTNTYVSNTFYLFEKIEQPLANVKFTTLTGAFSVNDNVQKYNADNSLAANGVILALTQNTETKTGEMFVGVRTGNIQGGTTTIYKTGNLVYATVSSTTDKTATANVMGISSNVVLFCSDVTGNFNIGDEIFQGNSTYEWANGIVSKVDGTSASLILDVATVKGIFRPSSTNVYTRDTTSYANINSFSTEIGICNVTNSFTTLKSNFIRPVYPSGHINIATGGSGTGFQNGQTLVITGSTSGSKYASGTANTDGTGKLVRVILTTRLPDYLENETVTMKSTTSTSDATGTLLIFPGSATKANVELIGTGTLANFSIANIDNKEVTWYNTDLLASNNYAGVSFLYNGFVVDGTGSGLSANGYGFFKYPQANINSIIMDCLEFKTKEVGSIRSITGINKGLDYTSDPYVTIIEPTIASQKAKDYILTIENSTGNFTNGEIIRQVREIPNVNILTVSSMTTGNVEILNVTAATGTFQIGETVNRSGGGGTGVIKAIKLSSGSGTITVRAVSTTFSSSGTITGATSGATATISSVTYDFIQVKEQIKQYAADNVTEVANGIVESISINASTRVGSITINSVSTNFVTTTNYKIRGTLSNANAVVTAVDTSNAIVNAQAMITSIPNTSTIFAKRMSINTFLEVTPNSTIIGSLSGKTANLIGVTTDWTTAGSGLNAVILTDSTFSNGHVTSLDLVDSGFGYLDEDTLQFTSQDKTKSGITKLYLEKQGTGEGYFKSKKGFLSDTSRLFDGEFYQEYSYQILSRLPFEKYSKMFKKVIHTAGTEFFGSVVLDEVVETDKVAVDLNMKTTNVVFKNISNTEVLAPNYYVYQVNGPTSIANGYIKEYPSVQIIANTVAISYEVGTTVYQPSQATNSASGYLQNKSKNTTHTILYLSNTRGTFAKTSSIEAITQRSITVNPLINITLKSVTSPNVTSQSFSVGESVYQGPVGSKTFQGSVIFSNSSVICVTVTSGSVTNNQSISSVTTVTTAVTNGVTSNVFTVSQPAYQELKTLFLTDKTGTFTVGETVYQEKHNSLYKFP